MIRYAVVGAGWISQEAFMPAVAATKNSKMVAIVSGNETSARKLADFYAISEVLPYADYDDLLASDRIDAVYIALPNSMHADFTIRALKAGKHVLVEKPLATSLEDAEAMVATAKESRAFMMTAYRLHNEPGTHAMLAAIRSGEIGDPVYIFASFGFQTSLGNHRLKASHWGGALPDVGVYCLNAARHIFASEPLAVQALASRPVKDIRFAEIDASLAVSLKFPDERLAQFFCSFGSGTTESLRVVGTKGELVLDPAFKFESTMRLMVRNGSSEVVWNAPKVDHFAGQLSYFSDCIIQAVPPEADGEEGLADMRALLAIDQAARTGETVQLPPRPFGRGISDEMIRKFPFARNHALS